MKKQSNKFLKVEGSNDGWTYQRLGDIATIESGYGFPLKYQGNRQGDIPFFKVSDISKTVLKGHIYLRESENYISNDDLKEMKLKPLKKGTVVFAKIGAAINLNRRAILDQDSLVDNNIAGVFTNFNNLYLYYYLLTVKFGEYSGITAVPSLAKSDIEDYRILFPPLKEQQKIAAILLNVDELIQKTGQIIEQTQKLKKGLMQRLSTKGIGHTKFKKTQLGEIPEEWDLEKLDNLLNLCQYGLSSSLSEKGMYPIFRMNNIENGYMIANDFKYIDLDRKIFEQFKLEKGDILFNRTNSIDLVGKLGIFLLNGDYTFASYLIRMRTIKEKLDSFFLNFYLNTTKIQYKIKSLATSGVSQANINAPNLKSLIIPVPSLVEQRRIAAIILNVDEYIKKHIKEKDTLLKLKKGLMQQLQTGKIRVKI